MAKITALNWAKSIAAQKQQFEHQDDHVAELRAAGYLAAANFMLLRTELVTPHQMRAALETNDTQKVIDAATAMWNALNHMANPPLIRLKAAVEVVTGVPLEAD